MTCYHPMQAYRLLGRTTETGKQRIVFNFKEIGSAMAEPINLPCQQCIGCRIDRSRQWAIRCIHEKSLFEKNCFITLTYADDHLPANGSLEKKDFQLFMKRLRKSNEGHEIVTVKGKKTKPIRYFHCGEYGESLKRPHHHAIIFNFDFDDRYLWDNRSGIPLDRSDKLERLWTYGMSTIGEVTVESAAYVARYITKKINGDAATDHYTRINYETGEITELKPEYITMSRRPGIGKRWFDKFTDDVYPKDFITHKGKKFKTPKYYDNIYDIIEPEKLKEIKQKRLDKMEKHKDNNTSARLRTREKCQKAKSKNQERMYENGIKDV